MATDIFLTVPQAAEACGVSRAVVKTWIGMGLKHYRPGAIVLILPRDLEAWVAAQPAASGARATNLALTNSRRAQCAAARTDAAMGQIREFLSENPGLYQSRTGLVSDVRVRYGSAFSPRAGWRAVEALLAAGELVTRPDGLVGAP